MQGMNGFLTGPQHHLILVGSASSRAKQGHLLHLNHLKVVELNFIYFFTPIRTTHESELSLI